MPARTLFVTGTDTGVGKTLVAAAIVRSFRLAGRRVLGLKPVASGCTRAAEGLRNDDALALMAEASIDAPYATVNPYAFEPPIAPHIAAAAAGVELSIDRIVAIRDSFRPVADEIVVEGAGGWRVPLGIGTDFADLAVRLNAGIVLVVGVRLGCLSHAALAAESIAARKLPILGWIANEMEPNVVHLDDNFATLHRLLNAPCLGRIPLLADPTPAAAAPYLELDRLDG